MASSHDDDDERTEQLAKHAPLLPKELAPARTRPHPSTHGRGCVESTARLVIFHALNWLLGVAACLLVTTGASVSLALLPLCCLGLVVFRVVLLAVDQLAQWDVRLHNYIAPPKQRIQLPGRYVRHADADDERCLAPGLREVSPVSLMAALYFATVKEIVSSLSLLALALPVLGIATLATHDPIEPHHRIGPIEFVIATASLFVLSFLLLHCIAWLSRVATRFFCSDRVSIVDIAPGFSV